ncbi:MAG: LamG-like jellyroll fold domain-containing protein, partial [Verrucomicrobiota bacterium]
MKTLFLSTFRIALLWGLSFAPLRAAEISPDSLGEDLILWLRTPDTHFDPGTGIWLDSSGRENHSQALGTSEAGVEYAAGTLGVGSQPGLFGQDFSTVDFDGTVDDLMVSEDISEGVSLTNVTVIAVYQRTMIEGGNTSIIRGVGFGSWKAGNTANNFNLGTDPSIRKDNGNIGAGGYSIAHPDDGAFLIRAARMDDTNGINEWFNVGGTIEKTLEDTGASYPVDAHSFFLGDLRFDSSDGDQADLQIGEVAVFKRALNDDEIEGVMNWIQANIGVSNAGGGGLAEAGMQGYWSFDDGAGTTAGDLSGNNRDAVFRNGEPVWGEGRTGSGLVFDGDDDLIVSGWNGIGGNAARSIAYWVKTDWDASVSNGIVGWGESTTGRKWHTRLNENAGNGVVGAVRTEIEGSFIIGSTPLNDGSWHHVVSVFPEGSTLMEHVIHYIDGVAEVRSGIGSQTLEIATASDDGGTEVTFGSRLQGANQQYFIGTIDDVGIWDRALTEEEIAALASGQTPLSGDAKDPILVGPSSSKLGQVPGVPAQHSASLELRNLGRTQTLELTGLEITGSDADHFTVDAFPDT